MENLNFTTEDEKTIKKKERGLFVAIAAAVVVVVVLAIIGFIVINPPRQIVQGQVEGTSVRVSGIMPGRVEKFYVVEGQKVHKGDTLVKIESATVDAKLAQALAMQNVADAQRAKAEAGARKQVISAAYDLWQQAKAALEIHKKTYERMESLYKQNVIPAQKRDEAKAAYDAAIAAESAAKAQYDLAKEGAQKEDKMAAQAMAAAAEGSVREVESILKDQYLTAPCDGEIADIFPNEGELVSTGTPIMNVLKTDNRWLVFNVRETMLKDLPMGKEVTVGIPALGLTDVKAKVYYIKDMGDYAVWRATKVTGEFDSRTFEIRLTPVKPVEGLRPGMTVGLEEDAMPFMIDIGFIVSLKRGVRQLCSRWLYFFAMIVIPIASAFFLLGLMRNGLPLHIPAAVVDLDNTVETRQIVRNIEASAEVLITHEVESEAAAMQLIREGKIYGFYVIPKNFTRDATAGQNPEIAYYTNSTFFIPSSLLFRSLKTNTVLTSAAIVRNYLVASGSATDTQAQALLQPVPLQTNMIHNPESNYSVYLSNSFIPALLALMILLTTAYSIWHEEKMRTSPQWIAAGRGSITIALLGKLLPQTVVFSAVGIFIQSVMYGYLHFPLNCSVLQTVSTMILFVLANQGFAVFLAGILPNLRLSLSLCSLIGVLTFSIGAFSYPLEDMYGSIAIFSYVVPARYYFLIYVDQMLNGIPLYYSRFYYAALLAFMLLPLLVARRMKRHALHPVYVP